MDQQADARYSNHRAMSNSSKLEGVVPVTGSELNFGEELSIADWQPIFNVVRASDGRLGNLEGDSLFVGGRKCRQGHKWGLEDFGSH